MHPSMQNNQLHSHVQQIIPGFLFLKIPKLLEWLHVHYIPKHSLNCIFTWTACCRRKSHGIVKDMLAFQIDAQWKEAWSPFCLKASTPTTLRDLSSWVLHWFNVLLCCQLPDSFATSILGFLGFQPLMFQLLRMLKSSTNWKRAKLLCPEW